MKPFYARYWYGANTQDEVLEKYFHSQGNSNDSQFANVEFDQLLLNSKSTFDDSHTPLYSQVNELVWNEAVVNVALFLDQVNFISSNVWGFEGHVARSMMNGSIAEYIWLEP